jgi:transcriptional regulator with XRE-family HTH domain
VLAVYRVRDLSARAGIHRNSITAIERGRSKPTPETMARLEAVLEKLREGEAITAGIDPERVIAIKRVFVDPPEHAAEALPETTEPSPAIERPSPSFSRPLATPPLGIV